MAVNQKAETHPTPPQSGIRDNRERGTAGDFLLQHLQSGVDLSIVSAYFTVSAYQALREPLHQIASLRFLFGEPSFVGDFGQEHKSKVFQLTENALALSNQLQQSKAARDCYNWIAQNNIEIRSISRSALLHGKMYHLQKDGFSHALLGSSNFTLAGLGLSRMSILPDLKVPPMSGNVELNLVVDSDRDREDLRHWFDEWWQDDQRTMDVKEQVLKELQRIYGDQSPQFIYYLTLFHLFRDLIDSDRGEGEQLENIKLTETKLWKTMLYSFQKDGAKAAINRLKSLNGCILADSVGLGKTFTALAVIKYFEMKNERVLVLCPKKLRRNWTLFRNNDKNNPLRDESLRYDVLSHTDLSRDRGEVDGLPLESLNWGNYDLVVIDESHNFRNNNYSREENKQTRYEKLINDVISAGIRTKVLLLSATPVNNTLADLRNQISLIAGGDVSRLQYADRAFADYLGIVSVKETTRTAQSNFTLWSKKPPHIRKAGDLLQELGGDFFKLLDGLTIARSRKQLMRGYSAEVSKIGNFPTRTKPESIHPAIDTKDETLSFEAIDDKINALTLALYNPTGYLRDDLNKETLDYYSDRIFHGFTQQGREKILVGMMKSGFLKRLESSVESFRLTLRRTIEKIDNLKNKLDAFEQHSAENPELDYRYITPEALDTEEEDMMVGAKRKFHLGHIDIPKWRNSIDRDRERLQALLDSADAVDVARDAKLAELLQRIDQKLKNPTTDKDGRSNHKVLIFTAYADTAEYLYRNLYEHIRQQGCHTAMVRGDGGNHCTLKGISDYDDILTRFSPLSKARQDMPKEETIDVLIATDCISEGQNLQDCDLLINYDIHWNPVRIIQRFGRIDRIGSRNEAVHLVNFWPMRDLDNYLNLKHRVEIRMALVDISATQSDNPLESKQLDELVKGELQFRSRQLKRLKEEILDLEELDESSISLSDFSLEEFRRDLMQFLESRREELETAPLGTYAVVSPNENNSMAQPGVIFCLRQRRDETADRKPEKDLTGINTLHPFYLIYVLDDGTVRLTFAQPKQALALFRDLAAEHPKASDSLCRLFDSHTDNGSDMSHYDKLISNTLQSIRRTFNKLALKKLTGRRDGELPVSAENPSEDGTQYELITWLAILEKPSDNSAS